MNLFVDGVIVRQGIIVKFVGQRHDNKIGTMMENVLKGAMMENVLKGGQVQDLIINGIKVKLFFQGVLVDSLLEARMMQFAPQRDNCGIWSSTE